MDNGQSFLKAEKEMRVGILGQVWYLIVSIPDLCNLTYFEMQRFIVTFLPTLLLFFGIKRLSHIFLHIFCILTIKTANSVFQNVLHTARLLIFSAYFQKYEIFVYESAKQAMDETFFSNLGLNV